MTKAEKLFTSFQIKKVGSSNEYMIRTEKANKHGSSSLVVMGNKTCTKSISKYSLNTVVIEQQLWSE